MEKIGISEVKINSRFRKDLGNIEVLAKSIEEVGLLHPIVVSEKGELIAGFRRLKACEKLGWTEIPIHRVSLKDLTKGEFHENAVRKDFTASELVAIKRALEPEIKEKAEERKLSKLKKGKETPRSADSSERKGETREVVAKFAGVSHDTLAKAEVIVDAAEKEPEKFGKILERVDNGKVSINAACIQVKRAQKHENTPILPDGKFDVIYADPPWKYDFCLEGDPRQHYQTMPTEEICDLPIPIADDAILFLWATNPKLEDALKVIKAWGFEYKTNLVWIKDKKGPGYYFQGKHELLLVAKRGNIPPPTGANRPPSVLEVPQRNHSQKPIEVYDLIERMYPNRKYLELFARNNRKSWVSWGLENERPI